MKKKHPLLRPSHRQARLEWAERHKEYTIADWRRVVWSEETKINYIGSDERKWVWKEVGEGLTNRQVEGTLEFGGGNVMMWGCVTILMDSFLFFPHLLHYDSLLSQL